MTYVVTSACIDISDKSCVDVCPVDCIYEGDRKVYIHPEECIDCGACESVCPQTAIFADMQVPAEEEAFVEDSVRFFAEPLPGRSEPLGMPNGASLVGPIGVDTAELADLAAAAGRDA